MNFDLSDEQQVVRDLAAQIFADRATTERVKAVEADNGFDRDLWRDLAAANLLGLCLPAEHGGSGMAMVELALLAEQQGRRVAPVPLVPTLAAAMAVAEFAAGPVAAQLLPGVADGTTIITSALAEPGANDPMRPQTEAIDEAAGRLRIRGFKPAVPAGQHADFVLVPASRPDGTTVIAIVATTAEGVDRRPLLTSNREPQVQLALDTVVEAEWVMAVPEATRWLFERHLVGLCAVQLGVCTGSLALTAEHVSVRQQFGKPLSAFQAVTQRAADGYILTEALRSTTMNAAWRLGESLDSRRAVLVAAYWAGEGAQRVVLGGQHLHGGVGSDVDYPVHRYFLWGMQLATALGTSSSHLARLGQLIKTGGGNHR